MTTITRTITGSKEDILAELRAHQEQILENSRNSHITLRRAAELKGYSDGMHYAIAMIEDWNVSDLPVMLQLVEHLALLRAGDIEPLLAELQTQVENYPKGDRYIAGVLDRRAGLHRQAVALRQLAGSCAAALRFGLSKPVREER